MLNPEAVKLRGEDNYKTWPIVGVTRELLLLELPPRIHLYNQLQQRLGN